MFCWLTFRILLFVCLLFVDYVVFRLDVAMNDVLGVAVLDRLPPDVYTEYYVIDTYGGYLIDML